MSDTALKEEDRTPADAPRWWKRGDVRAVFLIWLILSAVGIAFAWVPAWLMGLSASSEIDDVKMTMTWFTAIAMPVGAVIWAVMIYSLWKWRYRGEQPPPDDAPGFQTNPPTVVMWIVISAVLTLFVFAWGLVKIAAISPAMAMTSAATSASSGLRVEVTGNQWAWNFTYPQLGNIQSDVLHIPLGEQTTFAVSSVDVIHSFWIVQMAVKVDANPGAITYLTVTPTKAGTFEVRCAELCGLYHAAMETTSVVSSRKDFDAWVAEMRAVKPVSSMTEGGA